jgi:hypothetical protein
MSLFHVQAPGTSPDALSRAIFVRDGFSKWAFLFGPLWLLYHRLWLALLVWIGGEIVLFMLIAPHVTPGDVLLLDLLARLWLAFDGSRLRLSRRAALDDVVVARDLGEAESIFFRRHIDERASVPPA